MRNIGIYEGRIPNIGLKTVNILLAFLLKIPQAGGGAGGPETIKSVTNARPTGNPEDNPPANPVYLFVSSEDTITITEVLILIPIHLK